MATSSLIEPYKAQNTLRNFNPLIKKWSVTKRNENFSTGAGKPMTIKY